MSTLKLILEIILQALGLYQKAERKRENEEHQNAIDEAHNDPAGAFGEHFNSLLHDPEPDAADAEQADTGSDTKS